MQQRAGASQSDSLIVPALGPCVSVLLYYGAPLAWAGILLRGMWQRVSLELQVWLSFLKAENKWLRGKGVHYLFFLYYN